MGIASSFRAGFKAGKAGPSLGTYVKNSFAYMGKNIRNSMGVVSGLAKGGLGATGSYLRWAGVGATAGGVQYLGSKATGIGDRRGATLGNSIATGALMGGGARVMKGGIGAMRRRR